MRRIQTIDSHTGGEPTRVIIAGGPDLGAGSLMERRVRFREEHDAFRRVVLCEPRGSDVMVGALLCEPVDPKCAAGVIFCNNVGYLGMCGHGMIGLVVTLGHLGRIQAGRHLIETPVGRIAVEFDGQHAVAFENVSSYRFAKDVTLTVPGLGKVTGDIAWGGNWFFLAEEENESLVLKNVRRLVDRTERIKQALREQGITGASGAEIDHIELFGPPHDSRNHGRNFVLCPGGAYDRSPCGTGTSAKVACLASDGKLRPGEVWRQESVLGSVFEASYRHADKQVIPRIAGQAYITAEATLLIDDADPFGWGFAP